MCYRCYYNDDATAESLSGLLSDPNCLDPEDLTDDHVQACGSEEDVCTFFQRGARCARKKTN